MRWVYRSGSRPASRRTSQSTCSSVCTGLFIAFIVAHSASESRIVETMEEPKRRPLVGMEIPAELDITQRCSLTGAFDKVRRPKRQDVGTLVAVRSTEGSNARNA